MAFGRILIESIWKYTLNVWTRHNEAVHGKTQVLKKRHKNIQECITAIYNVTRNKVTKEDR